ncbi:PRC-barrel domain-containing protein [Candidatus Marsarchaeota archaeon]|jgi:sporulation protein YlmC with PRC-barrel domain|nr:PRC-barrel domain-containing protein [Candidatus Marsarchaeota archaeon]
MALVSELYGKGIISTSGKILGEVRGVVLNFEDGSVSRLLLKSIDQINKVDDIRGEIANNSIEYKRVKSVSENIVVSNK